MSPKFHHAKFGNDPRQFHDWSWVELTKVRTLGIFYFLTLRSDVVIHGNTYNFWSTRALNFSSNPLRNMNKIRSLEIPVLARLIVRRFQKE